MSSPNEKDIIAKDPNDYIYVSIKNYKRKLNATQGGNNLASLIGRPGPITGFIVGILDVIMTLIIKFSINMLTVCTYAFNWVYSSIFGNFNGIIPSSLVGGKVISMKFFRYTMTVLMPPFGILLSKGLYGWFNILICIIITYVNFMAGIIYAFVITARNRYADQYEDKAILDAKSNSDESISTIEDHTAFYGTCGFFILLLVVFYIFLGFF
jgi:uncharacterized membrane protein YqaE (UPF0057 family)